ncbi:MarR family winged helix-turn-helix transcriptional regulator [Haloactinopolyspora alba]|nr:MarR family winged helix-turn-helix transcriptional regulator [Haloactinopolyspora alba]
MITLQWAMTRRVPRESSSRHGTLPPPMYDVLAAVDDGASTEHPIGVTEVATLVRVDQPRASRLVAQAVTGGLLRREADPRDGRRSVLVLTAHGGDVLADARRRRRATIEAAMTGWSPAQRRDFGRLLTAFAARWDSQHDGDATLPEPDDAGHLVGRAGHDGPEFPASSSAARDSR